VRGSHPRQTICCGHLAPAGAHALERR